MNAPRIFNDIARRLAVAAVIAAPAAAWALAQAEEAQQPAGVEAAEASADETMTVTAKRRGKGGDRILAMPTPEGRAMIAEWLGYRHTRCGVLYSAEGSALRVRQDLPSGLADWETFLFNGCGVTTEGCDDLFALYSPQMLRKFLAIGYTELRYQGGACGIEAHLPVREVTHRCDEQYPMGGVRQFGRNVRSIIFKPRRSRNHESCVSEGLAALADGQP